MRLSMIGVLWVLGGAGLSAAAVPDNALDGLRWRQVGPYRAGWSTVAVGVPEAPDTYYFGAAGGGVWKTTDAGHNWVSIFDHGTPSIGGLALAATDPKVIYVGTGQPQARYDTAHGDGVYGSRDGGLSWAHLGLEKTRHIGAVLVDPRSADTVLVAAVGPFFAESADRGIYRSTDGGQHWTHALAIDNATGVVDLASDPSQPDTMFAAAWSARNYPWMSYFTPMVSDSGGVYRSADNGTTWTQTNSGLGDLFVNALITNGGTLFAGTNTGVYRSTDNGATWALASAAASILLGLVVFSGFPGSATWAIGLLVGIDLLFYGMTLLALRAAVNR